MQEKNKSVSFYIYPSIKGVIAAMVVAITAVIAYRLTEKEPLQPIFDESGMIVTPCFTPMQHCQKQIIEAIDSAKEEVLMMTYSFTAKPIANALINAQKRGVRVRVLADKSQKTANYSQIEMLHQNNILVKYDSKPAIAHNKVMIIDQHLLLTGSYNWTNAAEFKNTENILFIESKQLAQQYRNYWISRKGLSVEKVG